MRDCLCPTCQERNMNTATKLVMRATSYSESPSMNAALYSADQRTARNPERKESSFLDTIVGRRGSLPERQLDARWSERGSRQPRLETPPPVSPDQPPTHCATFR